VHTFSDKREAADRFTIRPVFAVIGSGVFLQFF